MNSLQEYLANERTFLACYLGYLSMPIKSVSRRSAVDLVNDMWLRGMPVSVMTRSSEMCICITKWAFMSTYKYHCVNTSGIYGSTHADNYANRRRYFLIGIVLTKTWWHREKNGYYRWSGLGRSTAHNSRQRRDSSFSKITQTPKSKIWRYYIKSPKTCNTNCKDNCQSFGYGKENTNLERSSPRRQPIEAI